MIAVVLTVVVIVALLAWRRRRRAVVMAGLNAERPQFLVSPPARRLGRLRDESL
jgi:hypothetical protein